MAQLDQVFDCLEARLLSRVGEVQDEDFVVRNPYSLCGLECCLQDGHTGEQGLGTGRPKLVLQLAGRVGDIGGRRNTGQTMDGEENRQVINLRRCCQ